MFAGELIDKRKLQHNLNISIMNDKLNWDLLNIVCPAGGTQTIIAHAHFVKGMIFFSIYHCNCRKCLMSALPPLMPLFNLLIHLISKTITYN